MTTKLVQKHLLKGLQEIEIGDEAVFVRIKTPTKEENLEVVLTVLNPEPEINGSYLEFKSRVNGEALVSLFKNKPNKNEFNAFVDELKRRALADYNAFIGLRPATLETDDEGKQFDVGQIDASIEQLRQHVQDPAIDPVIAVLTRMKEEPTNASLISELSVELSKLGFFQGAVLTYAPYIGGILSDDPFVSTKD